MHQSRVNGTGHPLHCPLAVPEEEEEDRDGCLSRRTSSCHPPLARSFV